MARRLDLQTLLETIADNVYFQPPDNLQMQYPCIVYQRDRAITAFADDNPYRYTQAYQVSVISRDPDNDMVQKIAQLPMCLFLTFFVANNLNHDIYNLFF